MSSLQISKTTISGVYSIERNLISDNRGHFQRLFCSKDLEQIVGNKEIKQINHTFTKKKGSVRGFHFQNKPMAEVKIVSCMRGKVLDVALDLRRDSPTFLKYYSIILSEANSKSLLIPEGCAHGFQSLDDNCELLYFHTELYSPEFESGINVSDPSISIEWPLNISNLSNRDRSMTYLSSEFKGI
jgi:dTDP-4-dehydrorhamnose 3,5-epimerase